MPMADVQPRAAHTVRFTQSDHSQARLRPARLGRDILSARNSELRGVGPSSSTKDWAVYRRDSVAASFIPHTVVAAHGAIIVGFLGVAAVLGGVLLWMQLRKDIDPRKEQGDSRR